MALDPSLLFMNIVYECVLVRGTDGSYSEDPVPSANKVYPLAAEVTIVTLLTKQ